MATTNYGFTVPTGSALVNPLTIDAPNWEKLDELMKGIQDDSVQQATELVSGKVHAISCLESGAVLMRFTATGDYRVGDTFTFNGTPIAAFLPDGSGLTDYAYRVNSEVLISVVGARLTVYTFAANAVAENAENLGGNPPEYYGKATDSITTYTHSRIGTINNFVGNGSNGKVRFAANILPGDTIQVNGVEYTAYAGTSDFVYAMRNVNLVGKTAFMAIDSGSNVVTFAISKDVESYTPVGYSTTPIDTGKKWIDGKTVWRKVVNFTTPGVNQFRLIPIGDTVETPVFIDLFCDTGNGVIATYQSFGYKTGLVGVGCSSVVNNDGTTDKNVLTIACTSTTYSNKPAYAILEYTRP